MTWVLELSRTAILPVITLLYRLHFVEDKSVSAKDVLHASDPESEFSSKITKIEQWKKVREFTIMKWRLQEILALLWCVEVALTCAVTNICLQSHRNGGLGVLTYL